MQKPKQRQQLIAGKKSISDHWKHFGFTSKTLSCVAASKVKNIFFLCQKESGATLVGWSSNSHIEAAGWRLAQVQLSGAKLKAKLQSWLKSSSSKAKTKTENETETERLRLKLTSSLGAQVARAWAADGWVTHTICETLTPTQQTWRNSLSLLQLKDTVF